MALSRLPPQSSKPAFDVRIHVLPPSLWRPHAIHHLGAPAHSFVANFLKLAWIQIARRQTSPLDITGTPRNLTLGHATNLYIYEEGSRLWGIKVGAGTTPPTPTDFKLQAVYPNGSLANQLTHATNTFVDPYIAGDITYAAISRIFTNNSGGSLYIQEIGLVLDGMVGTNDYEILVARDILPSTITLPNGQAKQFIYTFATEV